jgi:hypothetical protein
MQNDQDVPQSGTSMVFVVSKYFMLAEKDYERRLMRGKLSVILNEGFKKLYGFGKAHKSANK